MFGKRENIYNCVVKHPATGAHLTPEHMIAGVLYATWMPVNDAVNNWKEIHCKGYWEDMTEQEIIMAVALDKAYDIFNKQ